MHALRGMILGMIALMMLNIGWPVEPSALSNQGGSEDDKLLAYFKEFLEQEFRHRPLTATRLGDHRFDDRLDDISAEARREHLQRLQRTLADLRKRIDYGKLTRAGQIDLEIFEHDLKRSIWLMTNTNPFEEDPRVYNDYITESVYLLLTQSTEPKAVNVRNCVARMAHIPRIVAEAKKTLKNPPRVHTETAIRQNRGAIAFYSGDIFRLADETPQLSELGRAAAKVVETLKDYQHFLENDLLPRANGNWRLGRDKFVQKLDLELNAGVSADEVLRDAEVEAERVEREMYVISRQLWGLLFFGKPLPPDDPEGRRLTIAQVLAELSKEHGKPEELVADVRKIVDEVRDFIRRADILRLPEPDTCEIIEMPEFQRGNSTAYLNPAPPLDLKARSYYAVSPPPADWDPRRVRSYLEEYNRYMLKILTIHEAYPGHYVQLDYSNRCPSFIRRVLSSGIFAEGWAVYTEQMMLDQGYGLPTPQQLRQGQTADVKEVLALRLHQLKFYLRAVLNAILDHKMHCTDFTDEQAMDLLVRRGFQSEGEAVGKLIRAKQSSCQLSTYFVGRMAFYRLRQSVQRELGDQFDLGRYHEAVLAHGTLPVKYLPELVRERLKQPR
ncbi:MAG: DUF885 domain-containing protein [Gemmatales bacterium]|nr:DUF885 domain-containing protein [Gemmatales bacterium]MDW8386501.1 DUF885 domain-containing protein [Gemmatales bacterium]